MNPLVIGGAVLGGLGSLFGGHSGLDQKAINQLSQILSPSAFGQDVNQRYALLQGSPFGSYLMSQANLRGSQAGAALRRYAAMQGGGSAFAALASSAANTTQGVARTGAESDLFQQAMQQALASRSQLAQLAASQGRQPSALSQTLGGIGQTFGDYAAIKSLYGSARPGAAPNYGGNPFGSPFPFNPNVG